MIGMTEMYNKTRKTRPELKEDNPQADHELPGNPQRTRPDEHGDDATAHAGFTKQQQIINRLIDWKRCVKENPHEVKRRIRHGIPDSLRATVWQIMSGGHEIMSESPAVEYAELLSSETSELLKLSIVKDIPRTLKCFTLTPETYSGSLYNVLKAYDVYDRSRAGYIQGMSYLAGLILLYMDEEQTFWTMTAILNKPAMQGIYSERGPLLDQYVFQFGMLVKEQLPKLDEHFQEQRIVPSMYARRWFLTVFSADLPVPLVVRIWDVFIYEGINIVFQVGLVLLKLYEKAFLTFSKQIIMEILLNLKSNRRLQPDHLFPIAFSFEVEKRLPELELEYQRRRSATVQEFIVVKKKQRHGD